MIVNAKLIEELRAEAALCREQADALDRAIKIMTDRDGSAPPPPVAAVRTEAADPRRVRDFARRGNAQNWIDSLPADTRTTIIPHDGGWRVTVIG